MNLKATGTSSVSSGVSHPVSLGIDIGTSGCRAIAIDTDAQELCRATTVWPEPEIRDSRVEQDPSLWWQGMITVIREVVAKLEKRAIHAIAIDATSATTLLADANGQPLYPALMYNDARAQTEAERLNNILPPDSPARGASSGLAKFRWLMEQPFASRGRYLLHQCDWLTAQLCGQFGLSDENNSLKSGYDPRKHQWPVWLGDTGLDTGLLPRVLPPGTPIGRVTAQTCELTGLGKNTLVVSGTTDSTAAFLATGAQHPGEAVTSLGSTLVVKVLSETPIFSPADGVYSQPLGKLWLVGGASNSGGNVLRQFFSDAEMTEMTPLLQPAISTGLDFYPLPAPGERFPVNDPALPPRLSPRPSDNITFFQAMLEGISRIEQQGYQRLAQLGAPWPISVRTVGGGSRNPAWTKMRERLLGVPFITARHTDAAYGAACLAAKGLLAFDKGGNHVK